MNINRVLLIGRLTTEPELKATKTGTELCMFGLAVNRRQSKDKEQVTDFFDCTAFSHTAQFAGQYLHKGDEVCVIGSIQVDAWTSDRGEKKKLTRIIVNEISPGQKRRPATFREEAAPLPSFDELVEENFEDVPF